MDWTLIQPNVGFITGLTGNVILHELAQVTIESAQREFNQYQKPVKRYHSFMYKAGSWENYQWVIVKVEVNVNLRPGLPVRPARFVGVMSIFAAPNNKVPDCAKHNEFMKITAKHAN